MRARRIGTIIGVVAGIALCFGLGFGSGVIVQHSHSRKKEPKPIDPPAELSEVGGKIWELAAGVTLAEDWIWLEYDEHVGKARHSPTVAKHAIGSALPSVQLEEFFANAPEGMEENPEYWYERWNFWWSAYGTMTGHIDEVIRTARESQIQLARDKMDQYKDSYSPVTMRLALRNWRVDTEQEFRQYVSKLHELEPDNGFIYLMEATVAARESDVGKTLLLIDQAVEASDFSMPSSSLAEVMHEHWVLRGEEIPSGVLSYYYLCHRLREMPNYMWIRGVYELTDGELSDEEYLIHSQELQQLSTRFIRLENYVGVINTLSACAMIGIVNERMQLAYAHTGNEEGLDACWRIANIKRKLLNAARDQSGWPDLLNDSVFEATGKSWIDLAGYSDFIRLQEFGNVERIEELLTRYEEFEYPPLEPQPEDEDESSNDDDL
jgi:hypothetical protein